MKMRLLLLLLMPALAFAKPWWLRDSNAREGEFLQPDEAFKVTARVDGLLVGISRAITDWSYCTYLSDLAVDAEYQRQGIGRELIARMQALVGEEVMLLLVSAPAGRADRPVPGSQAACSH